MLNTKRKNLFILALVVLVAGCQEGQQGPPQIKVQNVWSRPVLLPQDHMADTFSDMNGVVYMDLINSGGGSDRLLSASAEVCKVVEIHQTIMTEERMRMKRVEGGMKIMPNSTTQFKPRGHHLMLIGLGRALTPGDSLRLDLEFENSGSLTVYSEVRTH